MNRREVLRKMCGLSGVAGAFIPAKSGSLHLSGEVNFEEQYERFRKCPVCKELYDRQEFTNAEVTTVLDKKRAYKPIAVFYFHADGKRCAQVQARVVELKTAEKVTALPQEYQAAPEFGDVDRCIWLGNSYRERWLNDRGIVSSTHKGGT